MSLILIAHITALKLKVKMIVCWGLAGFFCHVHSLSLHEKCMYLLISTKHKCNWCWWELHMFGRCLLINQADIATWWWCVNTLRDHQFNSSHTDMSVCTKFFRHFIHFFRNFNDNCNKITSGYHYRKSQTHQCHLNASSGNMNVCTIFFQIHLVGISVITKVISTYPFRTLITCA